MFYRALILIITFAIQAQANFDQSKADNRSNNSLEDLRSVANEMIISSNDSNSTFQEVVSINENWAFIGAENDNVYGANSGAVHVFKYANGKWIKHSKIIPHDGKLGDKFGSMISVSKNSNTVAITAKGVSSTSFYAPGAVYIYSLTSESWEYKTRLRVQGPNNDIGFGESLNINDTDLIIGAPFDDGAIAGSGSAYLYHRVNSTSWDLTEKLFANESYNLAEFGKSVAISGDRAIVGVQNGLNLSGQSTGYVVAYSRTASVWDQDYIIYGAESIGAKFGRSVSISGNHFIVSEQGVGKVYIYDRFIGAWRKLSTFTIPGVSELSVKIHDDRAIVGSRTSNNGGYTNNGSIQVYDFDGLATWSLSDTLTALDTQNNAYVGGRVDFINDKIMASSNINSAYLFNHNTGWSQLPKLTPDDSTVNDKIGYSVSISGDYAVVGAYGNDDFGSESGAAYVFRLISSQWINTGKLVPNDGQLGDRFGYSVSIDGSFVIVGTYQDDDMGSNAGAKVVFQGNLYGPGNILGNNNQPATLADNEAGNDGGGIAAYNGSEVELYDALVWKNNADVNGGAFTIETNSSLLMTTSNNSTCWNQGQCSILAFNNADLGGAIYQSKGSTATFNNSHIYKNGANWGLVIFSREDGTAGTDTKFHNNMIYGHGNNAFDRGDRYVFRGYEPVTMELIHNTITDNDVDDIRSIMGASLGAIFTVKNSIIHNPGEDVFEGSINQMDAECLLVNEQTSFSGVNINTELPSFVDPFNDDYHINDGSEATDLCLPVNGFTHDIDGEPRGFDAPIGNAQGPYDAGADETYASDIIFKQGFEYDGDI